MKSRLSKKGGPRAGAGRPKNDTPPKKIASFTLDLATIEALGKHCKQLDISKSEAVNKALIDYLKQNG